VQNTKWPQSFVLSSLVTPAAVQTDNQLLWM